MRWTSLPLLLLQGEGLHNRPVAGHSDDPDPRTGERMSRPIGGEARQGGVWFPKGLDIVCGSERPVSYRREVGAFETFAKASAVTYREGKIGQE